METEDICPRFDQLYVISDLHIGGADEKLQIFTSSKLLAGFIRSLIPADRPSPPVEGHPLPPPAEARVALVLNGDIVDFLAEEPPAYLDVDRAVEKLRDVVQRPGTRLGEGFCEVFEALRELLQAPKRHLVLVLGNHDLELALPHAQRWLSEWLTRGQDAARGRLTFATDGSGYRCDVGSSSVLCIHGEIADQWNAVDHHSLRAVAHAWKAGTKPPAWQPNAGTQLVRDVMNDIKREFPFVDLLKPEIDALLPILKALNAETFDRVLGAGSALAKMIATTKARREQFLAMDDPAHPPQAEDLFSLAALQLLDTERVAGRSAVEQAEADAKSRLNPMDLARQETAANELLSLVGIARMVAAIPGSLYQRFIKGKDSTQILLECLHSILKGDQTFDLHSDDEPFKWVKEHVSDAINFVVAGHTHLERCIFRPHGAYFNSGTWANLVKLDQDRLKEGTFQQTFLALKECKTIKDLQYAKLALTVPTVVVIAAESPTGPASGSLCRAEEVDHRVRLTQTTLKPFPAR
jgi:UDP-2,3-diacylglucosamine pyrophosphatase LpxH